MEEVSQIKNFSSTVETFFLDTDDDEEVLLINKTNGEITLKEKDLSVTTIIPANFISLHTEDKNQEICNVVLNYDEIEQCIGEAPKTREIDDWCFQSAFTVLSKKVDHVSAITEQRLICYSKINKLCKRIISHEKKRKVIRAKKKIMGINMILDSLWEKVKKNREEELEEILKKVLS